MKPAFKIYANSKDITENVRDRLMEMVVTDESRIKSDELRLTLDDRRQTNGAVAALPQIGTSLRVFLGYAETGLVEMGTFKVDGFTLRHPPATLTVNAKAAEMFAPFRSKKTRSWHDTTVGGIVSQIASEHGYSPKCDTELASIAIAHIDQTSESDMAFLTRLAEANGGISKPMGDMLVMAREGAAKSVTGKSMPVVSLSAEEITSWEYEYSARQPGGKAKGEEQGGEGGYRARWWDHYAGVTKEVLVGNPPYEDFRYQHASEAEARRAAEAKLKKGKKKAKALSMTLPGKAEIGAECPLHIVLRPGLPTEWSISKAEHTLSNNGYTTRLEANKKV